MQKVLLTLCFETHGSRLSDMFRNGFIFSVIVINLLDSMYIVKCFASNDLAAIIFLGGEAILGD